MDSDAETNVGMKAAQVGFTEAVLNKSFFTVDVKGTDCLYILPAKIPDAKTSLLVDSIRLWNCPIIYLIYSLT